jgi:high affinity Mn2+ porin
LALTGCETFPTLRSDPGPPPNGSSEQPGEKPEKTEEKAKEPAGAAGPPKPRTFPQAVRAYFHCLRCGPPGPAEPQEKPAADKDGQNGKSAGSPAKDEPKNGKAEKSKDNQQNGGEDKGKDEKARESEEKEGAKKDNGEKDEKKNEEEKPGWYSAHGQATVVTQGHPPFHSPYIGPNSLLPVEALQTSMTGTLFLTARLWERNGNTTELIFNPEIAGGSGLSDSTGIANFPNGEITRVGVFTPTPYIARFFVRQTFGFGGEQEQIEDEANQIAGWRDIDRITLRVGKMSATDVFDDNRYSHDPRAQFLPWSIMYNGAWDYPANVRGYTYGFAIDFNRKYWAFRYGIFQEPAIANGAEMDPRILKAHGQAWELEGRYSLNEHPGRLRAMAYMNNAHMGDYREALQAMPVNPDVTLTRAYRIKYGFGLSWDQELTKDFGLFSRLGWSDGHTESWAFTAVDRVALIGFLLNGRRWCRPSDQVGFAYAACGLAKDHRDYLAAGGLDFIIGDGALRYAAEQVVEVFYLLSIIKGMSVTADFQEVVNPAYNHDRGPVSIFSLRVHTEF